MADDIDRCCGPWSGGGGCNNPCDPGYQCPPTVPEPSCTALLHFGQWLSALEERAYCRGYAAGEEAVLGKDKAALLVFLRDAHDWVTHTHSKPPYEDSRERILAQLARVINLFEMNGA